MKLLGSARFITPQILAALEIAKEMKENQTHNEQEDEVERNMILLSQATFEYEIFRTNNAYTTWIGGQRFIYHDEVKVELLTKGKNPKIKTKCNSNYRDDVKKE